MILSILKKIYKYLNNAAVHGVNFERMPYNKQMEFISRFSEPSDDFERSYFKYKCFCEYCYYKRKWIVLIYNIGALLILPIIHIKLRKTYKHSCFEGNVDAVIENVPKLPNSDVIPDEINNKYHKILEIEHIDYSKFFLSDDGEKIYQELKKRYFFSFYFRLIIAQKLAQFSTYIELYHPKAIVFYSCEREFSGPLQTLLCEKNGAKYISFMHGDYISTLSFAFQRYSEYYVWDEAYKKMFLNLKCQSPMIVYKPSKYKGFENIRNDEKCDYFATYYFSAETKEEASKIHEIFRLFEDHHLRTKIRPHPRFSNLNMLKEVFNDIQIEDPLNVSLFDSISSSLFIVGLNTTVLSEAFFSNKKVVIDNVSAPEKYQELDERGYIMIKREHLLLSELCSDYYKNYLSGYSFIM